MFGSFDVVLYEALKLNHSHQQDHPPKVYSVCPFTYKLHFEKKLTFYIAIRQLFSFEIPVVEHVNTDDMRLRKCSECCPSLPEKVNMEEEFAMTKKQHC